MLLTGLTYTGFACGTVFVITELCQRACDAFNNIDKKIVQWNWYSFPIENQRTLPQILIVMQQPVAINCFGSIACTRETFKNVSKFTG